MDQIVNNLITELKRGTLILFVLNALKDGRSKAEQPSNHILNLT